MWTLTYKWAKRTHPKKSKHWIVNKYFGSLNRSKNNTGLSVTAPQVHIFPSSPGPTSEGIS
ncbi:hypothetical protein [Streptomyces sp. NPDC059872]|uniref:hypothetical protein n=1 Tax=Streptomyces sp. NPDC059872 TaxID=3346981 RepID=UPI00365B6E14